MCPRKVATPLGVAIDLIAAVPSIVVGLWGLYVMQKQTSAPLLFAHSSAFPVMYREPPTPRFNHLILESFAPSMRTPDWMCSSLLAGGVFVDDCDGEWRRRWEEFWHEAVPLYDHVLFWDATPEKWHHFVADPSKGSRCPMLAS